MTSAYYPPAVGIRSTPRITSGWWPPAILIRSGVRMTIVWYHPKYFLFLRNIYYNITDFWYGISAIVILRKKGRGGLGGCDWGGWEGGFKSLLLTSYSVGFKVESSLKMYMNEKNTSLEPSNFGKNPTFLFKTISYQLKEKKWSFGRKTKNRPIFGDFRIEVTQPPSSPNF